MKIAMSLRGSTAAALSTAALVGFGLIAAAPAHADTFVAWPDGQKQGPDGVVITRTGEHATVSPSLAGNRIGRLSLPLRDNV